METPQSFATMPRSVVAACQLIVASFLLGLVLLLPGVGRPVVDPSADWLVASLVFVIATGAVTLWLIGAVLKRRNWGRWAMLAVLGLSWFILADDIVETFQASTFEGALDVVCTAMEMTACVLLFGGDSARWFGEADAP